MEHKQPKMVAPKGMKKVGQCTSGNKTQMTVLGCCWPGYTTNGVEKFNHALSEGEVPDTFYGMSDLGWMDQELFASWFTCHFLKHAESSGPVMLILNGHSSLDLVQSAAEQDVIILCLPPHTTADSQPLIRYQLLWAPKDPFIPGMSRLLICQSRPYHHQISVFPVILSGVVTEHNNITAGFRHTGIHPFNPNAILDRNELVSDDQAQSQNGAAEYESVQSYARQFKIFTARNQTLRRMVQQQQHLHR